MAKPERRRGKPMDTETEFNHAVALYRNGHRDQAKMELERITKQTPSFAGAWQMLGLLDFETQRFEQALANVTRSVELAPKNADFTRNLGLVLKSLGRLAEAESATRQSIVLSPGNSMALAQLASILMMQQRQTEAIAALQQALRFQPGAAHLHTAIGMAWSMDGNLAEAEASYRKATNLDPSDGAAFANLGVVQLKRGQLADAQASLEHATRLEPKVATHWRNLGVVLTQVGKTEAAVSVLSRATELVPTSFENWDNLAMALLDLGKIDHAVSCLRQSLSIEPNRAQTWNNLGTALKEAGRLSEAVEAYQRSLTIHPDAAVHSNFLFCLTYDPLTPYSQLVDEHRRWGQLYSQVPKVPIEPLPTCEGRRLRVGYFSPDFRQHAVSFFIEPILRHHDPNQVELFAYAEVPAPDATTERLMKLVPNWRWTHLLSDDEFERTVRADRLDLLIDLAGHTARNRLPALSRKLAGIQALWIGYPTTTGLTTFDYRITEDTLNPPGEDHGEVEALYRLKCSGCYQPHPDSPPVVPLPALNSSTFTFGSPHNAIKLNDEVLRTWGRLLGAVPNSKILLFRGGMSGKTMDDLRERFERQGGDGGRLDFRDVSIRSHGFVGYMSVYNEVDVCLDSFPATAGTTVFESFWMGVPFVTLYGNRSFGRQTSALSRQVGLDDWVARSTEEYIEIAIAKCRSTSELANLRAGLRQRVTESRLGNASLFTRELEAGYWNMCRIRDAPPGR